MLCKNFCFGFLACSLLFAEPAESADVNGSTKTIRLWSGAAPGAKGDGPSHTPIMYVYPADAEQANGSAVIVLPGGGYHVHAIDHEGVQVARRLNRNGVTAFVLRYRLKPNGYHERDAFVDGQRAVRMIRARAASFGVDPNRIGVLGFSAGGHLATALGVNFDAGRSQADDPIERVSSRPDFMVVCYTVPAPLDMRDGREHGHRPVTDRVPPAFLWVTHQDGHRPVETAKFYQMLHEAGVDAELHIFGGWGPHGLGLAPGEAGLGEWPALLARWMRRKGLLTDKPRVAVSGRVTIDGEPLNRGWLTLTPVDAPGSPIAAAYITHRRKGAFTIEAENGPVTGRHRVTVHREAKAFLTEPSLADAEVFPPVGHGRSLEVDIKPTDNVLNVNLRSTGIRTSD